ncbi:hypothetical protein [Mycobacteroides abscessus]|uniref:hypothetical protein n=1 Tax=Mycobacteroides abscessus TaxID=36809 RepID=UPI00092CB58C|nr:hypothetical protein [Mycobacteroides abscessus]SHW59559.1 type VII secretion protein EccCa/type VII secretion protein EccCb [Mycobacteroides abscessus subsp. abscessus]
MKRASEVGLHVIVARRIDNWARGENTPLIAELKQALSPGLVMSGPRDQGTILGNTFAADQVAGRGIYVTTESVAPAQFARPDRQVRNHEEFCVGGWRCDNDRYSLVRERIQQQSGGQSP